MAAVDATASRQSHRIRLAGAALLALALLAVVASAPTFDDPAAASSDAVQVGAESPATANDLTAPRAHNSPELAVDPTDERFVALAHRLDGPEFSCGLELSGDGGRSWVPGEPLVALPEGVDHCYAPQVVFDADGTLYYLFLGLAGAGNAPQGAWLTRSEHHGHSFTQPRQVLGPSNYQVRLAVDRSTGDGGRLHLVWLEVRDDPTVGGLPATHNPIVAAHSDDSGQTFSDPVEVSGADRRRVVAPAVAVGGDGQVHVAYYDLKDDARDYQGLEGPVWPAPWAVEVATSTDGGETFADPVVVDDQLQPPERVLLIFTMPPPSVAAGADGNVYTAWHDARHGDWDVFVARSDDGGRSWAQPVVAGDDEPGQARQLLPRLSVAPDGRLDVVFFDRRGDADGHRQHVTYGASTDGGRSFSANRQLTSEPSDARTGPQFHLPVAQGRVELGLGLALHAGDTASVAAWPDTRFGVPGTAQQDIYTATLTRDGGDDAGFWTPIAVAGLGVVAGVVILAWSRRRRLATTGGLALLALLAVGCTPGAGDEAPLPGQPATVEVELDEYAFDLAEPVPPGRVVFDVRNRGGELHELVLLRLPEGAGSLEELLASPTPVGLPPTYTVTPREPGQSAVFAVGLEPGRYGLVCFVEDAEGAQHHQRGMFAEFDVEQ